MNKKNIWTIIILIILVALAIFLLKSQDKPQDQPADSPNEKPTDSKEVEASHPEGEGIQIEKNKEIEGKVNKKDIEKALNNLRK